MALVNQLLRIAERVYDHVPVAGSLSKPSAVYVDALGKHLAVAFMKALSFAGRLENEGPNPHGVESLVVNDLLAAGSWEVLLLGTGSAGSDLFWAGKSYGRYSETINAIAAAFVVL